MVALFIFPRIIKYLHFSLIFWTFSLSLLSCLFLYTYPAIINLHVCGPYWMDTHQQGPPSDRLPRLLMSFLGNKKLLTTPNTLDFQTSPTFATGQNLCFRSPQIIIIYKSNSYLYITYKKKK